MSKAAKSAKRTQRLERIKNARSLNDILTIVDEIAYEFKNSAAIVNKLIASLASGTGGMIKFDNRRGENEVPQAGDAKYVVPPLRELKAHIDVLDRFYDNMVELDAAEALVKQAFAGQKKQPEALRAIKELRLEVDEKLNDAYQSLNELTRKHIPKGVERQFEALKGYLITVLPVNSYDDMTAMYYVVPDKTDKSIMQFCCYLGLDGLKNREGYRYDLYYFVLTGVVQNTGALEFYLNSLPNFILPGRFPLGKQIRDTNAMKQHVDMLLSHNDFVATHEKLPLPFDQERANKAGFTTLKHVESVHVADDTFTVVFTPDISTRAKAKPVVLNIMARLNSILGENKTAKIFQPEYIKRGGKPAVKFILTPNLDRRAGFSLQKLEEVSELFNLTENQQAALRFALQNEPAFKKRVEFAAMPKVASSSIGTNWFSVTLTPDARSREAITKLTNEILMRFSSITGGNHPEPKVESEFDGKQTTLKFVLSRPLAQQHRTGLKSVLKGDYTEE